MVDQMQLETVVVIGTFAAAGMKRDYVFGDQLELW